VQVTGLQRHLEGFVETAPDDPNVINAGELLFRDGDRQGFPAPPPQQPGAAAMPNSCELIIDIRYAGAERRFD
jgi:hypothetical protein